MLGRNVMRADHTTPGGRMCRERACRRKKVKRMQKMQRTNSAALVQMDCPNAGHFDRFFSPFSFPFFNIFPRPDFHKINCILLPPLLPL